MEPFYGGEQHQLALAMVMIRKPKFLILDEPSAGLSPANVNTLYQILTALKKNWEIGILLIEQNVKMAFEFSDKVLLLQDGIIKREQMTLEHVERQYFK